MTAAAIAPTTGGAAEAAKFLAAYAKGFGAGAFATPLAKELTAETLRDWRSPDGAHRTVAVVKRQPRTSKRTDWTGAPYLLPQGALVATHVARTPGAPVPRALAEFDYLFTYVEDGELTAALRLAGRPVIATRISAAAEIVACWGRPGDQRQRYPAYDLATVTQLGITIPEATRLAALGEVRGLTGWHDDFPFYSDGSWSALSLRGFKPDDPQWGIKPAEMPREWKAQHPLALGYTCEWTTLAARCPTLVGLVGAIPWWRKLERVRLLQMSGRNGQGGTLSRHSDITDRAAGTRDGQIVRFHLPLITDPRIEMDAWTLDGLHLATHLRAWHLYYLDARKPHAVRNPTGVDRIHLVVDVVADAQVREYLA